MIQEIFCNSKKNPKPEKRRYIGFVGLAAGAGATTLAFSAAEYLAARMKKSPLTVTMLELDKRTDLPAGCAYDKVGIDRRFAGRQYVSIYKAALENKPLREVLNIDEGINWALRAPQDRGPAPAASALFRLLNNVSGDIIVCDIPAYAFLKTGEDRELLLSLLADMDDIICVFDPLPSRLFASVRAAEICRSLPCADTDTIWLFNKYNPGADMREVVRFTGIKKYHLFPALPAEIVYRAEYACRSLASRPEAGAAFQKILG